MIESILGRLLVVDDEIDTLTPLCDLLSEWGYEVVCVTSGKDALEVLKEQTFDLLLTDLVMSEMDGIELSLRVRHVSKAPILMLSSSRTKEGSRL